MPIDTIDLYVLHVDGKMTDFGTSLDEAQQLAKKHMAGQKPLRIESKVILEPSQVWDYDYNTDAWVKR